MISPRTEVVDEITRVYQSGKRPFPYEDLHKVHDEFGASCEYLNSDLDTYAFALWGYANAGKELLRLSFQQANMLQHICKHSFFEEYPQYKVAEPFIKAGSTPDLNALLQELEFLRSKLKIFAKTNEN